MPPFGQTTELVTDLTPTPGIARDEAARTLPSQPSVTLGDLHRLRKHLQEDLCSSDLETMAPRLWIMTTPSSANINSLHRQRVKGREIIVTEEPRLHLVWIHHRIFIKPIPRYLLSHAFWAEYLDVPSTQLGAARDDIRKAATGFLRTYRYLIRHESDFKIAQRDELSLIPRDVDWASFCRFVAQLETIEDDCVSGRYRFGELRLTRLNLYAPLLLGKSNFEQVHGQYGDFFARLYGPILFLFALVTTILSSIQVALAAEQFVPVPWKAIWYVSRWFSVLSLVGSAVVAGWFVALWTWMVLDECVYTTRQKMQKRRALRSGSKC